MQAQQTQRVVSLLQENDNLAGEARERLNNALQRLEKVVEKQIEKATRPIQENTAFKAVEAECARLNEENAELREELKRAETTIATVTDTLDDVIAQLEGLLAE